MSGSDIKQALRKLDYPICAKEALYRIGNYFLNCKFIFIFLRLETCILNHFILRILILK